MCWVQKLWIGVVMTLGILALLGTLSGCGKKSALTLPDTQIESSESQKQ